MGELAQKLGAVAKLGLEHDGQVTVGAQRFQMKVSHPPELLPGIRDVVQRCPGPFNEAMEGGINGCHEQLVFILEIEIASAVGYPRPVSNLGDPGVKKAVLRNDLNGCIEDALVLVRASVGHLHGCLFWSLHGEVNESNCIDRV